MESRPEVDRYLELRSHWDRVVRDRVERGGLYEALTTAWFLLTPHEQKCVGMHCVITYH